MKLYFQDKQNNKCFYSNYDGSWWDFNGDGAVESLSNVYAESANDNFLATMIIGAIVGLLLGAWGIMLGAVIGGFYGTSLDFKDEQKAQLFNQQKAKYLQNKEAKRFF